MPGAFPFNSQPNPEEDNENATSYAQEVSEPPLTEEQIEVGQPETPLEPAMSPPTLLEELPAEAQDETNGGPLGCCLGITVGIMLSLLFGLIGFGRVTANVLIFLIHVDPITNIRIATGFFAILGAILGGYFGWKVGKRVYREYDAPVIKDRTRTRKRKSQPKEARL